VNDPVRISLARTSGPDWFETVIVVMILGKLALFALFCLFAVAVWAFGV
jgi:hypothetical protein